jgi:hypothetical protein
LEKEIETNGAIFFFHKSEGVLLLCHFLMDAAELRMVQFSRAGF